VLCGDPQKGVARVVAGWPMTVEEICNKCGKCCYEKRQILGVVYISSRRCEWLTEDNLCGCYEHRHVVRPTCLPALRALQMGALPGGCPFVKKYAINYRGVLEFGKKEVLGDGS